MAYYGAYPQGYPGATYPGAGFQSSTYARAIGPQASYIGGAQPSAFPQQAPAAGQQQGQTVVGSATQIGQPQFGQIAGQPQFGQPFYGGAYGFGGYGAGAYGAPQFRSGAVVASKPANAKVQREVSERAAQWTAKTQWDFDELPHPDGFRFYMSSLMFCCAADGDLDPKEKAWVLGYAAALGAPMDLMKELETLNVENLKKQNLGDDFEKFCQRNDKRSTASKRGIIYDCIRAASADGTFSKEERKAVVNLAIKFGLTEDNVGELEKLHLQEKALKEEKAKLVHRYGST